MHSKIKFISTKLKMPAPRKNYILRSELFEKLKELEEYRLILVKGVAGSGKTTLMTSFIREYASVQFKWLTLDSDNNNVISFWYYFVEAVSDYLGDAKDTVTALFDAVLQKEDIDRIIEILINQLDQKNSLAIVLDDFHHLEDENLLKTIEYFIKYMPGNIHIVLLTRNEPGIYLGDLLMGDGLLYIDETRLKFSRQEGTDFLLYSLGLKLPEETVNELNELCEGWVGGLQLIALAYINNSEKIIKEIKINNKYTVEYLSKEILDSLPEKHRSFLIRTCVLSYFGKDICDKLLGIRNSNAIISELLGKDLFLVCIDEDRQLYRYHNVFGEFLKLRFSTLDEQEKSNLLEKASAIFKETGDLEESARLQLHNRNYEGMLDTLDLLEPNYKSWSYLSRIPVAYLKNNLNYIVQLFYYYYYNSDYKEIELMVEACGKEMEDQKTWRFLKIIKSILVDFDLCTELMTVEEIERIGVSDTAKSILYLETAAFLYIKFDLNKALDFVEKAAVYDLGKNPFITLTVLSLRCGVKEELGDLEECERLYEDISGRLESFKLLSDYKTNYYIGLTGVYTKTYQIEKALQCIGNAAVLCKEDNLYMDAAYLYNLAEIRLLQGNLKAACQLLEKLLHNDAYRNILFMSGVIKLLIYAGCMTPEMSRNYKKKYVECDTGFIRIEDTLAYAKVMLYEGNSSTALELADEILPAARNQKIKFKLVETLLFKISVLHTTNQDTAEIKNLMREAIYYSYENRILSPYIYEGEYIIKYLAAVREERPKDLKNGEKVFIYQLEELLRKDKTCSAPLSERELEVLREMATGATNKVIGDNLCISVSTVKTHIINIYSKLNVGSRVEAVELARKMKLIT